MLRAQDLPRTYKSKQIPIFAKPTRASNPNQVYRGWGRAQPGQHTIAPWYWGTGAYTRAQKGGTPRGTSSDRTFDMTNLLRPRARMRKQAEAYTYHDVHPEQASVRVGKKLISSATQKARQV